MITLLRSMSCNAKEWINIDHNEVRHIKTVVDFILGLHDVLKVLWVYCLPVATNVTLELFSRVVLVSRSLSGNISAPGRVHITPLALSKHHVTLETVNN